MPDNAVVAESVDKSYPDGKSSRQVLSGVGIEVPVGQIVGVQGPSGCGKTTLLSIVGGLLRHDRGRVVVAGHELDYTRPRDVARVRRDHVGLISQTYALIEAESVFANVTLPLMFDRPRPSRRTQLDLVERVLQWASLDINTRAKVGTLSQGERQRVAIARALVRRPSLLVADEPTAALDTVTGALVVERLRAVADQGVGVLIATHDQQVADACDVVFRFEGPILRELIAKTPAPG